jgi:hypothetical protein
MRNSLASLDPMEGVEDNVPVLAPEITIQVSRRLDLGNVALGYRPGWPTSRCVTTARPRLRSRVAFAGDRPPRTRHTTPSAANR